MRLWPLLGILFLVGCDRGPVPPENTVIAKVNNYNVTAEDFQRELAAARSVIRRYPNISEHEFKIKVLDEMIVRQLLLEEAQKLDVDKDPAFMREVEGYWRQALLKMITARKTNEFIGGNKNIDQDVRALYARETVQLELDIVTLADEQSAIELSGSGENYTAALSLLGPRIISHPAVSSWMAGDFAFGIEEKIWALKTGQISAPLFSAEDGGWLVIKVISRQEVPVKPFAQIEASLRKRVAREKTGAAMDRWIGELRSRARIEQYPDILDKVGSETPVKTGGQNAK